MHRADVIQRLLDRYPDPVYLEVGVETGVTFHAIRAARKIAVDPTFQFDQAAARADPINRSSEYHEVESDIYFADIRARDDIFDVIFLDGLHTFDQTLKDLLSAIDCLRPDGVIVIDDIMPDSYAASLPEVERVRAFYALRPPSSSWMGDVYRLVFFIDQYLPAFSFATMGENHGQLVMWRQPRPSTGKPATKVETIARLEYADAVIAHEMFKIAYLNDIVATIPPVSR